MINDHKTNDRKECYLERADRDLQVLQPLDSFEILYVSLISTIILDVLNHTDLAIG
jgi:hypothetical protein